MEYLYSCHCLRDDRNTSNRKRKEIIGKLQSKREKGLKQYSTPILEFLSPPRILYLLFSHIICCNTEYCLDVRIQVKVNVVDQLMLEHEISNHVWCFFEVCHCCKLGGFAILVDHLSSLSSHHFMFQAIGIVSNMQC